MKKNIEKKYVEKVAVTIFCFVMLVYGQSGYAVIEKFLIPASSNTYILGTKDSGVSIESEIIVTEVAAYLRDDKLQEAYIRSMPLEYSLRQLTLSALAKALQNNTALTILSLDSNYVGAEGTRILAGALRNNTVLTTLVFGNNCIGNQGAMALAEALRTNTVLTMLYLWNNNIGTEGAIALAEALRTNTTLITLYLSGNNIGVEGAIALAEVLRTNTTLTTLSLNGNIIGIEGVIALVEALQANTTLTMLDLRYNHIGAEGTKVLTELLRTNNTLITIYLEGNDIGTDGDRALSTALVYNYSLLKFDGSKENKKVLLRNTLLVKLFRKIKRACAFTFTIGHRNTPLLNVLPNILELVGLDLHNRATFANIQIYNNENNRRIIFGGTVEEVIRLFYYGNRADYGEIIREVNQIRRLQREILLENHLEITEGELLELPEGLRDIALLAQSRDGLERSLIADIFFGS